MEAIEHAGSKRVDTLRHVFDDVLNRRDADALLPYWAEDIVEEFPVGIFRGRKAVRDHFAAMFEAIPDFHIAVRGIAESGETVFVRWRATGTFRGAPWLGIEANGSSVDIQGIDHITMKDGLVVHNFVLYDQLDFARQLGILPAMGSRLDRAMLRAFNAKTRVQRALRR